MSADIEKAIESLKKCRDESLLWYQPLHGFLDEAVETLGNFSADSYDFYEVFSEELIKKNVLEHALPYLQAYAVNGKVTSFVSTNPGGVKELDHSDKIHLYKKVIGEWEDMGLVNIKYHVEKSHVPIDITINPRTSRCT